MENESTLRKKILAGLKYPGPKKQEVVDPILDEEDESAIDPTLVVGDIADMPAEEQPPVSKGRIRKRLSY
jgi:hypothetical protein